MNDQSGKDAKRARVTAIADAWERADVAAAAVDVDRVAARDAHGHRELVCDLILSEASGRELFTALHAYGRLLAEKGASPSAFGATLENARASLNGSDAAHAKRIDGSARAAIAEGYLAGAREAFATQALRAWDPPACIAKISDDAFAVSAHLPSREPDDVGAWATRVARYLKEQRAARAIVEGDADLAREVADAISLAGIDVTNMSVSAQAQTPPNDPAKKKGILSKILG